MSPLDFIPVFGLIDDMILLPLGIAFAIKLVYPNIPTSKKTRKLLLTYKYLLTISIKKALHISIKSSSFNVISSPTLYFKTDLAGSNLIVLSAHIILLLFIIELHKILISF
jgi:hypothetical protein